MGLFKKNLDVPDEVRDQVGKQNDRIAAVLEELRGLERQIVLQLDEVRERLERQDRRLSIALEEIDERIDRGNKIWRKIRARERYAEGQEEDEDGGFEFPGEHVEGSPGQGVLPLRDDVAPTPGERPFHLAVAEEMAMRIAMGE